MAFATRAASTAAALLVALAVRLPANAGDPRELPAAPASAEPARPAAAAAIPAAPGASGPGSELAIHVLTFGPGDHPFFKFGHNAIWVHDESSGRDAVYNFGTFGFDSPWLVLDFLKGRLRYWLSVQSLRRTLLDYRDENRSVVAQELRLTPSQRLELATALAVNAREENKYYRYDYYRDNCSTRVRDAVDAALGGALRAVSGRPAALSWRGHTRRLTADDVPVYLGLHVAMGDFIDQPVTLWEEMFLPERLQYALRLVRVPGPLGPEPLVASERLLVVADRPEPRSVPPSWELPMALVGALLGGLVAALALLARRRRWAAVAASVVVGLYGLVSGVLGLVFAGLWALTDHEVAYRNENLLQLAPWAVLLVPVAVGVVRRRAGALSRLSRVLATLAAASWLGLALKVLPALDQDNAEIIALMLPLWTVALGGVVLWARSARLAGAARASGRVVDSERRAG